MKFTIALSLTLTCAMTLSSLTQALPYYVGENPTPETRVILGLKDSFTRVEKEAERGNFADLNLTGQWKLSPTTTVAADLPFYSNSKPADGDDHAVGMGNASLKANWNTRIWGDESATRLGYFIQGEAYLPTTRSTDTLSYVRAYAPTALYTFSPYTTTLTPAAGLFVSQNQWSAKTNIGYGFHHVSDDSFAAGDRVRHSLKYQLAGTFHPMANLNLSMEYNMMVLDDALAGNLGNWRHSVAPSISGEYRRFVGALYSEIPVDSDARELSNMLVGAELGYSF